MLTVRGLGVRYPDRDAPALTGVDFQVRRGESMLVLGPSGSGKSTLTLCLNGLIPNVVESELSGSVTAAGRDTAEHPVYELARAVGLVFQDPEAQFCTLTVADEIAFGLENLRTDPAEIEARIDEALAEVGLEQFRARRLDTLSGGEKQRVALASVLALRPQIIVLDEPSANLDPPGTAQVFGVLRRLAGSGRHALVVIEHRLDEVIDWIDTVLVLDGEGKVVCRGTPREVFYRSAACRDQRLIWRPPAVALAQGLREAGWRVSGEPLTAAEAADALRDTLGLLPRLAGADGPGPVSDGRDAGRGTIAARHLSFGYRGGPPVLRDVSFALRAGELTAIVGANGAGKSTLASLLSGVLQPPAASAFLDGRDVREFRDAELSAQVGYVFQNPEHQFVSDSVRGELAYSLSQTRRGTLTPEQEELVAATLRRFNLFALRDANPFTLSQGQKRRLSVAAMLVRGQSALFLDEPTFGQDRLQTERLLGMLEGSLRAGRAIVMVTHDMDLIAEHAQRLLVLRDGALVFDGTPRRFFADHAAVSAAGLSVPFPARVASLLGREAGPALLTVADYLAAAGLPDADREAFSAGNPEQAAGEPSSNPASETGLCRGCVEVR